MKMKSLWLCFCNSSTYFLRSIESAAGRKPRAWSRSRKRYSSQVASATRTCCTEGGRSIPIMGTHFQRSNFQHSNHRNLNSVEFLNSGDQKPSGFGARSPTCIAKQNHNNSNKGDKWKTWLRMPLHHWARNTEHGSIGAYRALRFLQRGRRKRSTLINTPRRRGDRGRRETV